MATKKPVSNVAPVVDPVKNSDEALGPPSDGMFEFQSTLGLIQVQSVNDPTMPAPNRMAVMRAKRDRDHDMGLLLMTEAALTDRPEQMDLIYRLDNDELQQFYRDWFTHSGIELGKSSA